MNEKVEQIKETFQQYFTQKQYYTLLSQLKFKPYHTIFHGSVRAGKTTVGVFLFLLHIKSFVKDKRTGKKPFFFVSGSSINSLNNNIVKEINNINSIFGFGLSEFEIKPNKKTINIWGFDVTFYGALNSDSYSDLQGVSAAGWYANEVTLHHENFIEKAFNRLDQPNSRVFWDCNPDAPDHIVKARYIDKGHEFDYDAISSETLSQVLEEYGKKHPSVVSYYFNIYDNTFLSPELRDNIIRNASGGHFYNRDILGQWVGAEGLVYSDFNKEKHNLKLIELENINFTHFIGGMDWGFKHHNVFTLVGVTELGEYILLHEVAEVEKPMDYWVRVVRSFLDQYGDFIVYCDSARPDYIDDFKRKISDKLIQSANKSVLEGIAYVSSLIAQNRFKVVIENCPLFFREVFRYSWERGKDTVIKTFDDCMDSLRYALYSAFKKENSDPFKGKNPYTSVYSSNPFSINKPKNQIGNKYSIYRR